MRLECIHFAQDYRIHPDRTHDLIGMFNTLSFGSFPADFEFWVCVELVREVDEGGVVVPSSITLGRGGAGKRRG